MVAAAFPDPPMRLAQAVTRGVPNPYMSKLDVFNPDAVREINYGTGRHQAWPKGRVVWPARDEMMNLHYKHMGRSRVVDRHAALKAGLGSLDRRRGWGFHYDWSKAELAELWEDLEQRGVDVAEPGFEPWGHHLARRWWREPPKERLRGFGWTQWRRLMALRAALG